VRDRILRADLVQSVGFDRSFQLGGPTPTRPWERSRSWSRPSWMRTGTSGPGRPTRTAGAPSFPRRPAQRWRRWRTAVQGNQPVLFETRTEEEYLRAHRIAAEYGVTPWFRGNGQEYRIIDVLRGRTDPLIVPLAFPDAPDVGTPEAALNASLGELRHWYLAPTSPARWPGPGALRHHQRRPGLAEPVPSEPPHRGGPGTGPCRRPPGAHGDPRHLAGDRADPRHHRAGEGGQPGHRRGGPLHRGGHRPRCLGGGAALPGDPRGPDRPPGHLEHRLGGRVRVRGGAADRGAAEPPPGPHRPPGRRASPLRRGPDRPLGGLRGGRDRPAGGALPGGRAGLRGGDPPLRRSVDGENFYGWGSLPNGADPAFRGTRTEASRAPPGGPWPWMCRRSTSPSSAP
jgi:hypothetical protein